MTSVAGEPTHRPPADPRGEDRGGTFAEGAADGAAASGASGASGASVESGGANQPAVAALRAVVLTGSGRFADAWHPFAETSGRLASILGDAGFETEVADVDERMPDLSDADLVVLNIGAPSTPELSADSAGRRGLLRHLARGGPLLVMHVSATSLPAIPEWESILGGIWVRGATMHPDYGLAHIRVYPDRHPIVEGSSDFDLYDERYSYLRVAPEIVPLATHLHDGIEHPILWAHTYSVPDPTNFADGLLGADFASAPNAPGARRTANILYDALGHDARSYESPEHRRIIVRAARWLTGRLAASDSRTVAARA